MDIPYHTVYLLSILCDWNVNYVGVEIFGFLFIQLRRVSTYYEHKISVHWIFCSVPMWLCSNWNAMLCRLCAYVQRHYHYILLFLFKKKKNTLIVTVAHKHYYMLGTGTHAHIITLNHELLIYSPLSNE